ncbi:acyl-CoA dehydrogenase family protein [Nonomuraea sp. NPDC046802]|uniref:acyl-CoA dehydrogenase family protein n=1 Tax=Nonomuraea sp. NPDC046802 TaxID=3154919 RepID=UPI003410257F
MLTRDLLDLGWTRRIEIPNLDSQASAQDRIRTVAASDFSILGIPESFNGLGGKLLDLASAQRALARRDPGVAIALNMHSLSMGLMTDYWERNKDISWIFLEAMAERHMLMASAFAEPGGSVNFMRSRSEARLDGKNYRVTGTKFPCSLATTADLFCMTATVVDSDETIVVLCPRDAPGVRVEQLWDSIGMRDSDTAKVEVDNVEIDHRLVLHKGPASEVDGPVITGLVWFTTLAAATYHGVLTTMIDLACDALAKKTGPDGDQSSRRVSLLGEAVREAHLLGAFCQRTATLWQSGELRGDDALCAAMTLRASMSDVRDRVAQALTRAVGSSFYTRGHPLSGVAMDSLAVHHHPPSLLTCDPSIGGYFLGRPINLEAS